MYQPFENPSTLTLVNGAEIFPGKVHLLNPFAFRSIIIVNSVLLSS